MPTSKDEKMQPTPLPQMPERRVIPDRRTQQQEWLREVDRRAQQRRFAK